MTLLAAPGINVSMCSVPLLSQQCFLQANDLLNQALLTEQWHTHGPAKSVTTHHQKTTKLSTRPAPTATNAPSTGQSGLGE